MAQEASEMAEFAGLKHGEFCWTEIASSNAEECKSFYSAVFGWTFHESSASSEEMKYEEYSTGGEYPAGGLYQLTPGMFGEGVPIPPPHFMTYIAVDDVDEYARRAAGIGGTVMMPPSDIPNTGRFAIIQDPTGAAFSIFKMAEGGQSG